MQKNLTYALMGLTLVLLQIFLFDNIALSSYFHPLIYVAFIILLPLDTKPIWTMLLSTAMGLVVDVMTGMGGLNVIACTALGFFRPMILSAVSGHSPTGENAITGLHRFTEKIMFWYITAMVFCHSVIYFFLEALSWDHIFRTILRLLVSDIGAILFIWYFVKLFIEKILKK